MAVTREEWPAYREQTIKKLTADGWVEVTREETRSVCADREIFNGCTTVYLAERFGEDNVQHVSGINWFRRIQPKESV